MRLLGIDLDELEAAWRLDEAAARRRWRAWASEPITPRLEVQHGRHWFSVTVERLNAAPPAELEERAAEAARQEQRPVRLVLSRRESVSFDRDGQVTARSWARYPTGETGPFIVWRGERRSLY